MSALRRPQVRNALRAAISLGLLFLLFRYGGVDAASVAAVIRDALAQPLQLAMAVLLYCVLGSLARGMRWRALVRSLGHGLRLARSTELFLVGNFFNQILPTGMGGDVPKMLLLTRDGKADGLGGARAASSVLVDRAMGFLPLLAIGLAVLLLTDASLGPLATAILVLAGLAGTLGLVFLVQARRWLPIARRVPPLRWVLDRAFVQRFVASFAEYGPRALLRATGWGFVFSVLLIAANVFLGLAVGIPLSQVGLMDWALVVPLIALSILLPSIGGWGVREFSYVALLGTLSRPVSADTALAVSLLFQGLNLLLAVVGGLLYALHGGATVGPEDPPAAEASLADETPPPGRP